MFPTKIIAISGHAGHGKDTAAGFISAALEKRGYRVLITHYADLLKYICRQYFGWDGQKDEKGRALLQHVGTDIVRKQLPNFWVGFMGLFLWLFRDQWDYVIIPDARFPNEISFLEGADFDVIHMRIVRPGYEGALTEDQKSHASETALDDVEPDIIVFNDGSLEDLETNMNDFVEEDTDDHKGE